MGRPLLTLASLAAGVTLGCLPLAAQSTPPAVTLKPGQEVYHFSADTALVLIDLSVRDKSGNFIRDLKPSEVTVYEDGKPQAIKSFDLEDLKGDDEFAFDDMPATGAAGPGGYRKPQAAAAPSSPEAFHDRRLLMFYLDFVDLTDPDDAQHAVESVEDYIRHQMEPADLVALAWFGDQLTIDPTFTSNKDLLLGKLKDLEDGVDVPPSRDPALSLKALQRLCDALKPIQQKKSLVWLTDGVAGAGRADVMQAVSAATRAAITANVVLNTWDARGLVATATPGNNIRGALNAINRLQASRNIINALAVDTGGRALFDENEPTTLYTQIQKDTASYYLISYHTANPSTDGKFRRLEVKVNRPGVKLSYRSGYGAPKDWAHFTDADRKQQMQDQLDSNFPERSFSLRAHGGFARIDRTPNYQLTITLQVPSAQVTTVASGKTPASIDFAGVVLDAGGDDMADLKGTLKLLPGPVPDVLYFETGTVLPAGIYQLRFAARDNLTGKLAATRATITIR